MMSAPSSWKYVNKGLLLILGAFALATIACLIFLSYTLIKLDHLITASNQNIGSALALQNLMIHLDEAETNVRGYIITGEDSFLNAYNASLKQIKPGLAALKVDPDLGLTPSQLQKLQSLTEAKMADMQQKIATRSADGEDSARAMVSMGTGTELMQDIRSLIGAITASRLREAAPRQQQSHRYLWYSLMVASGLALFVLGICGVLIWYFQFTILRERALESTKNEFLSLASHQLRTPATNVKQYVGLLLDGYLGSLTDKQRDALQIAYKNNESEIRIMNDLLDVAKLDLKRIQLHKQRVDIVAVVNSVVRSYRKYLADRSQTLTLKAPPALMAPVDREYFKGAVEKLIDNAVRYSRDNTAILVRVRPDAERGYFEVVVRDRGPGIHKREVPKLFMKFSRLSSDTSANSEGSGMGLYWVKQVMSLHGGSVRVASREGRGSRFTIRLPLS